MKHWPKVTARVAFADRVLDVPKFCIHLPELGAELIEHDTVDVAETHGTQSCEFLRDIVELARVLEPLGLYFEDGDLVHQFAHRDRHQDVLRRKVSRAHVAPSAFAVACGARSAIRGDEVVVRQCPAVGGRLGW